MQESRRVTSVHVHTQRHKSAPIETTQGLRRGPISTVTDVASSRWCETAASAVFGLIVRAVGTSRSISGTASTQLRRANFRLAGNLLRRLLAALGSAPVPASVSAFPLAGTGTGPSASIARLPANIRASESLARAHRIEAAVSKSTRESAITPEQRPRHHAEQRRRQPAHHPGRQAEQLPAALECLAQQHEASPNEHADHGAGTLT